MNNFNFNKTNIEGAYIIDSKIFEDNRGNFIKNFEKNSFEDNGIVFDCTEDFITCSSKYVVRGLHFQLYHPQVKLVSVVSGKVFDVIVDLREDSPTFGKWEGYYLSSNNRSSLLIPRGCAHGFVSLSEDSIVSYKCDGKYDLASDMGIIWNDPELAIEWPIPDNEHIILGKRDKALVTFDYFKKNCRFTYE